MAEPQRDENDRPTNAPKLDQIANQHRENLKAEGRASEAADHPDLSGPVRSIQGDARRGGNLGQRSFAEQEPYTGHSGLNYHQHAIRGDYGDAEKQRALDAYNRGEQLDGPPQVQAEQTDEERAAAAATLQADRPDGSQSSTTVSSDQQAIASGGVQDGNPVSTDQQAIAARMAADAQTAQNVAPGAAPAKVVTQAPVTGKGKESSTASKTVVTQPPSKPAKK